MRVCVVVTAVVQSTIAGIGLAIAGVVSALGRSLAETGDMKRGAALLLILPLTACGPKGELTLFNRATREFHGARLTIETRPRQRISIDGEVLARTPVVAQVAERAIEGTRDLPVLLTECLGSRAHLQIVVEGIKRKYAVDLAEGRSEAKPASPASADPGAA